MKEGGQTIGEQQLAGGAAQMGGQAGFREPIYVKPGALGTYPVPTPAETQRDWALRFIEDSRMDYLTAAVIVAVVDHRSRGAVAIGEALRALDELAKTVYKTDTAKVMGEVRGVAEQAAGPRRPAPNTIYRQHKGGGRPADASDYVEVVLRDGTCMFGRSGDFSWSHAMAEGDIMGYRNINRFEAEAWQ